MHPCLTFIDNRATGTPCRRLFRAIQTSESKNKKRHSGPSDPGVPEIRDRRMNLPSDVHDILDAMQCYSLSTASIFHRMLCYIKTVRLRGVCFFSTRQAKDIYRTDPFLFPTQLTPKSAAEVFGGPIKPGQIPRGLSARPT